jgi:hypothetical protein
MIIQNMGEIRTTQASQQILRNTAEILRSTVNASNIWRYKVFRRQIVVLDKTEEKNMTKFQDFHMMQISVLIISLYEGNQRRPSGKSIPGVHEPTFCYGPH